VIDRLEPQDTHARARVDALELYRPLGPTIEAFWLDRQSRRTRLWAEHRNINEVMLATRLAPDGFLTLLSDVRAETGLFRGTGPSP
jgi:hypothetical protein